MKCDICQTTIPEGSDTCPKCGYHIKQNDGIKSSTMEFDHIDDQADKMPTFDHIDLPKKKTQNTRKKQDKIFIIIIVLFLIFSVFRIGTHIISSLHFDNTYEVDYDEEVLEFSSLEELELMYEDLDASKMIKIDTQLQEAMEIVSSDVYVDYTIQLDQKEEEITNFQMTYCLTDEMNREWDIYYNYDYGNQGIWSTTYYDETSLIDFINTDLLSEYTRILYGKPINKSELHNELVQSSNNDTFHFTEENTNLEAEVNEDFLTITIYQS